MSERRCGTCKHWTKANPTLFWGNCSAWIAKIPCIDEYIQCSTDDTDGNNCPLWQPKEAAE